MQWQQLTAVSLAQDLDPMGTLWALDSIQRQLNMGISAQQLLYALKGEELAEMAPADTLLEDWMSQVRADLLKSMEMMQQGLLTPTNQLRLWITVNPAQASVPTEDDVSTLMEILTGAVPSSVGSQQSLSFCSPQPKNCCLVMKPL